MQNIKIDSPAKINLSLKILRKRGDGYHDLEMTLSPISLYDQIKISERSDSQIVLTSETFKETEDNLVVKAAKYFFCKAQLQKGINIELVKNIPMGAGLGGGSSNAASVIIALEKLFNKTIRPYDLREIAFSLGADVPFFLQDKTAFVEGVGEKLKPTGLEKRLNLVLIYPEIHLSTKEMYGKYDSLSSCDCKKKTAICSCAENLEGSNLKLTRVRASDNSLRQGIDAFLSKGPDKYLFNNDFQAVAELIAPKLKDYLGLLKSFGALVSMMSGSGSSLFGIFVNEEKRDNAYDDILKELNKKGEKVKLFKAHTLG